MTPQSFLLDWTAIGMIANHLWQSTAFIVVCWLATRMFRKNRASLRHAIWMAASLKFLVPLSLLVSFGGYLGTMAKVEIAQPNWPAVQKISAPFTGSHDLALPVTVASAQVGAAKVPDFLPVLIVAAWLTGVVVSALCGIVRWRRLAAHGGEAIPLQDSREAAALERVQSSLGWNLRVRLASFSSAIEPGVWGTIRPVLSLPAGICDRLDDRQLDAIIAHELCHVRRRDNLAAVMHVIVETIFWFHPLVWWIGSRLVDERERACDEKVLECGNDPHVYAQAILRVCEFYLATPLALVSRVTGSDLEKRIEEIMTQRSIRRVGPGGKLLLTAIGVALLATPIAFGLTHPLQGIATGGNAGQVARDSAPKIQNTALQGRSPISDPAPSSTVAAPTTQTTSFPRSPQPPATLPLVLPSPPLPQTDANTPDRDYIVGAEDQLEISVWRQPELTRTVVVRPDGRIGVPLLNDVQAAGLTPMQLRERIRNGLSTFLSDPQVSVIVVAARNPHVTIQGGVVRPGLYLLGRPTTVMELIAQAGGLSPFAQTGKISIIRQQGGAASYHAFDYSTFRTGSWEQNLTLKAGDIVVVP